MRLKIDDLYVEREGRTIIEGFSGEFISRSITLLKGANGSGKSTLLAAIAGDVRLRHNIKSGEIHLNEVSLRSLTPIQAAKVRGFLQQRSDFSLAYSVRELLELVIRISRQDSAVRSLKSLAVELDLEHLLERSVLELSGGERQRVSLAITLVRETPLYLLDEPLSAQDLAHSASIARYLKKLANSGAVFIIATHESPELAEVATKEMRLEFTIPDTVTRLNYSNKANNST